LTSTRATLRAELRARRAALRPGERLAAADAVARHLGERPELREPGYVGMKSGAAELAVTHSSWTADAYGMTMGDGPRVEMYVYVDDLDVAVGQLQANGVVVLRAPADMPWGERIATVTDPDGNPVALCQQPAGG